MEPTDKRSVGCEDDSADCRFLENDLREWIGGGGGGERVIIVEGHAKIFGENKQTKKTKKLSITGLYRDRQCRPLILIKHL